MDLIEKRKQTFYNNNILENMKKIPEILERKIFEFIPLGNLKILNHEYLNKFFDYNFYCFRSGEFKNNRVFDNYLRFIVRNDLSMYFYKILSDYNVLTFKKKIFYKEMIFSNRLDYLSFLAKYVYNSSKINFLICQHGKKEKGKKEKGKNNISKKRNKNKKSIKIKSNKWSN